MLITECEVNIDGAITLKRANKVVQTPSAI